MEDNETHVQAVMGLWSSDRAHFYAISDARRLATQRHGMAAPITFTLTQVVSDDEWTEVCNWEMDATLPWVPDNLRFTLQDSEADISLLFLDVAHVRGGLPRYVRYALAIREAFGVPGRREYLTAFRGEKDETATLLRETETANELGFAALIGPALTVERTLFWLSSYDLNIMPYQEYLTTPHWQRTRDAARERAGNRCQLCNSPKKPLDTHHRTYERRGFEQPADLIVLCRSCHSKHHDKLPKGGG